MHLDAADPGLASGLEAADAQRGRAHIERFVAGIVAGILEGNAAG